MADYSKQTWVDDDGTDTLGTVFTKARMDHIEQGIFDAGKRAVLVPGTGGAHVDTSEIEWIRTSDGALVAYDRTQEAVISGADTNATRDQIVSGGGRGIASHVIQADANTFTQRQVWLELLVNAVTGTAVRSKAKIVAHVAAGAGSIYNLTVLDDAGYSDWVRVTKDTYANRPAASANNQGQFYFATDTKALYYNDDGTRWIQLAGPQEASSITTPATGFGTHYVNYNTSFRYWKDALGYVHVVGEINDDGTGLASVAANAIIWDGFPAGYRPTNRSYFTVEGNSNTPNHILINTSGQLRVSDNATNANRYMNFGHITFPTF